MEDAFLLRHKRKNASKLNATTASGMTEQMQRRRMGEKGFTFTLW